MGLLHVTIKAHRRDKEVGIDDVPRENRGMLDEEVPRWSENRQEYLFDLCHHLGLCLLAPFLIEGAKKKGGNQCEGATGQNPAEEAKNHTPVVV
jgi:hypothetical protein